MLTLSKVAVVATAILFVLSAYDYIWARHKKLNGPIRFMTMDNFRHYACLFIIALFAMRDAVLIVILVDAAFNFFRRPKMGRLVGSYMGLKGGRRESDPPPDTGDSEW